MIFFTTLIDLINPKSGQLKSVLKFQFNDFDTLLSLTWLKRVPHIFKQNCNKAKHPPMVWR